MFRYRHLELLCRGPRTVVRVVDQTLRQEDIEDVAREWNHVADCTHCRKLVVDCSNMEVVGTGVLSKLLVFQRRLKQKGAELALCGVSLAVREVLSLTRLDRLFAIEERESRELVAVA